MQGRILLRVCFGVALLMTAGGCDRKKQPVPAVEIAVANSYLYAAVQDLCGSETPILSLVPPGMCPGHFDISPGQVNQLCHCKLLLVFGFQSNIENVVSRIRQNGLTVYKVSPEGGLCLPQTYIKVVEEVAKALSEQFPQRQDEFQQRLAHIEVRLKQLESELRTYMDDLSLQQTSVLASGHQAEFAKWLGFDVVSTFSGGDAETPAQINESLKKVAADHIGYVIANQQEGTALASALAKRLDAQMAVFSNFPAEISGSEDVSGFDAMLWENVQAFTARTP